MLDMIRRRLAVHRQGPTPPREDDRPLAGGATVSQLQAAANYWTVSGILPSDGNLSIMFGLIGIGIAGALMSPGLERTLAALTGLLLIASGIWLRTNPQPAGFIADGVGTCAIGAWMMSMSARDGSGLSVIYGTVQIVVGVEKILRFFPLRRAWSSKPPAMILHTFEEIIGGIASDSERVEFSVPSFPRRTTWQGQLRPEFAVFLSSDGSVIFSRREDVTLAHAHKRILREEVRAKIVVARQALPGVFDTEMFERLRIWTGAPPVKGIVVHPPSPPSRVFRARTVYIGAALWLAAYALFFMAHGERLVSPDSTAFIVLIVACAFIPTFTFVFALWQGVHWALTRGATSST
jgi:hypothetical protein